MVIRDTNISGDLEEKLGKNIWWKPNIDKKEFKKLCVKRSLPGIIYTSLYFLEIFKFRYICNKKFYGVINGNTRHKYIRRFGRKTW